MIKIRLCCLHLENPPTIGICAVGDCGKKGVQHEALNVRAGQGQEVVQALVPRLESTVPTSVLTQAHCCSVQQPSRAVPAGQAHFGAHSEAPFQV